MRYLKVNLTKNVFAIFTESDFKLIYTTNPELNWDIDYIYDFDEWLTQEQFDKLLMGEL